MDQKLTTATYRFEDLLAIEKIISESAQTCMIDCFRHSTASYKTDGSIVTNADIAMQESLSTQLKSRYPQVEMLSEELTAEEQASAMASGKDYWCLDPLDGTTNYHATFPLFSVSLALISQGHIVLAVIYDPVRREFFSALKGQGFWVNGEIAEPPLQPEKMGHSIAFIDFKRLDKEMRTHLVNQPPYKSQRNIGTCALEWAWLASGRVHLLIHGSEKFWDYAAGSLLLEESGGCSETHNGEPVFNETLEPRSVVAASNSELFQQWSSWIRAID
ncbi:MAG: inositol monophosphatase family protein [Gammaproteobacteria bacterium]|nr:inositol monophosphatase family protein [Gammaproteobacteria bacterium]